MKRAKGCRALMVCVLLAGCGNPVDTSINLYHGLEGGQIAAQRPPPPGAGMPYPSLNTVPPKPAMPDPAYRSSLEAQLAAERDRVERLAADSPIAVVPTPPPAVPPGPVPVASNNATLDAAEAPAPAPSAPAKPAAQPGAAARPTAAAGATAATATPADAAAAPAVSANAGLELVGAPPDQAGLPDVPAAPPPPASFEGVPAEPAPTVRVVPVSLAKAPAGTQVFFADGAALLPDSQTETLKDIANRRGHRTIEIIGLGEAHSDTPDGQAAAIALALRRAHAVQVALAAMHVPQSAMRLGANAFGRGAVLRLLP